MKKVFVKIALILTLSLLASSAVHALTLADIELLVALGIISGEQADIAKSAISSTSASTPGTAGSAIKKDEFSNVECLVLNQNIILGTTGTAVSAVQGFLKNQGYYTNPVITTYFGTETKTAIIDFQIATGLITSSTQPGAGSIGPLTREKIQEVSCNALNTPKLDEVFIPERETRPVFVPKVLDIGGAVARVQSTLIDEDRKKGNRDYRYTMDVDIAHNNDVDEWRVTLICNKEEVEIRSLSVSTNKGDIKKCGDSAIYKASTKGSKTIKIKYTNTSAANQSIGVGVEALDKDEKVMATTETLDQLPPKKAPEIISNSQGFQIVPGTDGQVVIPRQRICDEGEQIAYLKYVMTHTIYTGNPIAPPPCWPGNVQCTYDYPPSYCYIVNGVSSRDLCVAGQFFYDGLCRDLPTN